MIYSTYNYYVVAELNLIFTQISHRKNVITLLIFMILIFQMVAAQSQEYKFEKNILDLDSSLYGSFLKDSSGFIWFGGLSGAFRFDGYELKQFTQGKTVFPDPW